MCVCVGCRDSRTETAVGTTPLAGHASLDVAGATLQEHTHTVSVTHGGLKLEWSRFDLRKVG